MSPPLPGLKEVPVEHSQGQSQPGACRSRASLPGIFAGIALVGWSLVWGLAEAPAVEFARYWVVTPLAFLAAAFANATAIGGGFVFIPLFIFGFGMAPQIALKLSLGTQSFGMSAGAIGWSRQFIEPRYLLLSLLGSGVGMGLGTFQWVASPLQIKAVFGWVSIAIAGVMALEMKVGKSGGAERVQTHRPAEQMAFLLASFGGGIITAWVSLGIGEVVALWLLFVHRLRIETAIGTGVAALALSSILGFLFHGWDPDFPWVVLAFTVPGVLFGGYFGGKGGRRLESRMAALGKKSPLKLLFAVVVFLDGTMMLFQTYSS